MKCDLPGLYVQPGGGVKGLRDGECTVNSFCFKGAPLRFSHIETFSFDFSNSSFIIRVNLLHP